MGCSDFDLLVDKWIDYEKELEKLRAADASIFQAALGLGPAVYDAVEVLKAKGSVFNLLDAAKADVLDLLQGDDAGDLMTSQVLAYNQNAKQQMDSIVGELDIKVNAFKELLNNPPPYDPDKAKLHETIDDFNHLRASLRPPSQDIPPTPLQDLVDKGIVSQGALDEFMDSHPIAPPQSDPRKTQVVSELRDRYYTIEPKGYDQVFRVEPGDSVEIVDEAGDPVSDISGFDPDLSSLDPTGRIVLRTPEGEKKILIINVKKTKKRPTRNSPSKRFKIRDNRENVQGELKFEVWACLILDVMEWILEQWDKLRKLVEGMLRSVRHLMGLQGIGLASIPVNLSSFGALASIAKDINDLLTPGDDVREILGIRGTLTASGLPSGGLGGRTVCDFNHERYCNIRANLETYLDNLLRELDSIDWSFGGIPYEKLPPLLDDIIAEIEGFLGKVEGLLDEGQEKVDALKGVVCAFVSRQMRGTPKALSDLEVVLISLGAALLSAPSFAAADWGLSETPEFARIAARLQRAGYVEAATAILSCDFLHFFRMDEMEATAPGAVARCIEDLVREEPNAKKSHELKKLASVARSRGYQATMGQRVREGVRNRYYQKSGVESAEEIKARTKSIIEDT